MKRGTVDFTFLHRIEEVELNLRDERWQSALALALTLPDICGGIAFPDLIKRYRDGRMKLDRQKNPARDVGSQYIRWFDEYAGDFFKISPEEKTPYICGERCWQLRCEYLHQNKGFLNDGGESEVQFHLGINCGTSLCQMKQTGGQNGKTEIRIDIEQFCNRMCQAAKAYYYAAGREKDFSLYNTPVLDFVQARQGTRTNPLIAVMCQNRSYAEGLGMVLESITGQVLVGSSAEEMKKKLGKRKPVIWIITEEMAEQSGQPWKPGANRPVILLAKNKEAVNWTEKKDGKLTVLQMPAEPQKLRAVVRDHLA